ncbi:gliding motility-associated C-terminal domain-containing protein [Marivirga arenosa]|uniref:Gliding motility-associated C-terminal domain-containing protein n=1 Tax=Marivirga arenosa TaxID=3059076 RepID=A0AA51RCG9_9BACT|nr:gliding motility-associated C-terminal domain-containing protein [Marivirga sp. ABR2-2]WMN06379.1 gliding motility-associated C-terminal domain-containing protein [Marivirga sp. ABR2-2]
MRKNYAAILILFFSIAAAFSPKSTYAQLSINASVTQNVSCFDGGDGEITLNITSGTAPFTVEFSLTDGFSDVPIATISGTTDTNIVLNDAISTSDGSVTYQPPFPGFGIRANDNPTLVSGLGPGYTYKIRVTSAIADAPFRIREVSNLNITEPTQLVASVNTVTDDCDNLGSGSIDIDVSGGTPDGGGNYFYSWSNAATTQDISGLSPGSYDVTITDDNGCTTTITGITVDPGPNSGVALAPVTECNTTSSFDLFSLLDGSQDGGGSWAQATGTTAVTVDGLTGEVDFSGAVADSYTFEYTVTGAGACLDAVTTVQVDIVEGPNSGVAQPAADVCNTTSSFDLFSLLDGSQDAGGSWAQATGTTAVTVTALTGDVDFSGAAADVYTFEYTVSGTAPCVDAVTTVTVNVSEDANSGVALAPVTECNTTSSFDLFSLLDGSQDAGGSWAQATGTTAVTVDGLTGEVDFSGAVADSYTFEYTVTGAGACLDAVTTVQVDIVEGPNSGVAQPAADVCNTTSSFDLFSLLDGSQDGGGSWAQATGTTAVTVTALTGDVDFSGAAADVYTFEYTVSGTAPCVDAVTTVTVNVSEDANSGVALAPVTECNTTSSFDLFSLLDGSQDGGGSWAQATGTTAVTVDGLTGDVDFSGAVADSYTFEYTVTGAGACLDAVTTVQVDIVEGPNSGVAQPAADVCNTTSSFDLFSLLDGSQDGGGSWAQATGTTAVTVTALTGDVDFSGAAADVYTFEYTVSGTAPCVDAVTTVTVNVSEDANSGVALAPVTECNTTSSFDLFSLLDGSQDGGGSWAQATGTTAVTVDGLTGDVDFSGAVADSYTFEYTVTGAGACLDAVTTVQVDIVEGPNSGVAQPAADVCNTTSSFDLFSLLDGSQDGGGSWAQATGTTAVTVTALTGDVDFSGAVADVYTFEYTVSGTAPCVDAVTTVTVNVSEDANSGVALAPVTECNTTSSFDLFSLLDGSQDGGGSWAQATGTTAVTVDGLTGEVDFSGAVADSYTFEYTVTGAGACLDAVTTVQVDIVEGPNSGVAQPAADVCNTTSSFDLFSLLDGSQDGGGSWAQATGTTAVTVTALTGDVDFSGAVADVYTFEYTVSGTAPCVDAVTTVTVNVSEDANSGVALAPVTECNTTSSFDLFSLLDGSQDGGGSWAQATGTTAVTVDGLTGEVDFSGAVADSYTFEYTVTGAGACLDAVTTVQVDIVEGPNSGVAQPAADVCNTTSSFDLFSLLDGSQDAGGSWAQATGTTAVTVTALTGDVDFSGAVADVYTFEYTVSGTAPCVDAVTTVTVNVSEDANSGVALAPVTECNTTSSFDLFSLLDGSQDGGGSWAQATGTTAVTVDGLTGEVDFSGAVADSYTFEYTVTGAGACLDAVTTVQVDIVEGPNSGVAQPAADVCNTTSSFDLFSLLDGSQDGGGSWAQATGTTAVTVTALTGDVDFSGAAADVYTFEYTVSGTAPCVDAVTTVTVNVSEDANSGVALAPVTECNTTSSFDLFSLLDGSQDGGGSWAQATGTTAVTVDGLTGDVDFSGAVADSYTFEYTVTGAGACLDAVTTVQVDIVEGPNSGVAQPAADVCNTTSSFDLFSLLDGSQDGGGSWAQATGTTAVTVTALTGDVDFSGAAADVYTFEYTVSGTAPCVDAVTTVTVNVSEDANSGVALAPVTECNTTSSFDLFSLLDGSQDGGGSWAQATGTTAVTVDGLTGDVDFSGAVADSYTFEYTVTGAGACLDAVTTVQVDIVEGPNSGVAQPAADVCNTTSSFDLFSLLDGSQDGGGSWAQATGTTAVTVTALTGDVDFSGAVADVYTFEYTVSGTAPCVDAVTTVTVNVSEDANSGVALAPVTECNTTSSFDLFSLLDGSQDAGGSWAQATGTTAVTVDGLTGEVDFSGAVADTYTFDYTVTGAGACLDAVTTVQVDIVEGPNSGVAQPAADVCNTTSSFDLFSLLDGSQDGGGSWAQATGTTAVTVTALTGDVDFSGAVADVYTFEYTVSGTAPCVDAVTTVTVNVSEDANSGVALAPVTECNTTSSFDLFSLLDGSQDGGGSWAQATGTTAVTVDGLTGEVDFSGAVADTYTFDYTVTGAGACLDAVTTVQVDIVEGPNSGVAQPAADVCNTTSSFDLFSLLDGSQDGGGSWAQATGTTAVTVTALTGDVDFSGAVADVYTFEYTVSGTAPCVDAVTTVTVNVSESAPNSGVALAPVTECNTTSSFDLFSLLDGSQDAGGSWSQATGTTAVTVDGLTGEVDFSGAVADTYTFEYAVNNACGPGSITTVQVDIVEGPNSGVAQPAADVCNTTSSFDLFSLLDGSQDGGGSWAQATGTTAVTVTALTGDVDFSGAVADVYTFEYTVSGTAPCVDAVTTVTVNVSEPLSAGTFNSSPAANLTSINSPFDLFTLLDDEDAGGSWSQISGLTSVTVDGVTGNVDFSGAATGTYEFTYTVNTTVGVCSGSTDSETVVINFLNFECEDTKFSFITEDATCSGVQDGLVFLFLQNVSNAPNLQAVINTTDTLSFANPGNGGLVELDTTFFSGSYDITLYDPLTGCDSAKSVLVGQKQSITPLVNTSDATCDNPVGQIQVTIDGTFDFVLLDSTDTQIETNTTGLFTDLAPAKYGIAFNNTGGCQVDTVKNIIINEPTQVSNSALDLTVVEPSCNTTTAQILINFELEGEYFYQILDTAGIVIDSITTDSGEWTLELDTLGLFELVVTNIDNPGVCEPNSRNFNIERSGGFTATVVDKTDVVCFGDNTGSVTIELDGIGSGFYSLDGFIWNEFISGEPITGLTAQRSILVSDQGGTSECEQSITIDIQHLSQPIEFVGNANITLVTQASCTTAEEVGVIKVPEVTGGVAPYVYSIDGDVVELDGERNISGLARNANELTITDNTGCSETFDIRSIVSPNEIRAEVVEINPTNNCVDDPEGISVTIDQATIDNVPGPYNLILNKVNDTTTSEYVLNINTNGSREFIISQFDLDNNIPFEKGARYRWTIRATDDDQACSADNFVTINGGAIIPTFDIQSNDVACFQESGSIEISNIVADETIPLNIEVYEGNDVDPAQTFTLNSIPESRMFLIDQSIYGMIARGDYIIKLTQQPDNCNSVIESDNAAIFIDAPVNQLNVELVPEPNLPPGIERERSDMNPMPTTRPDQANGSISIRLVEPTSGANGYSAQIFLLTPLGGNNSADYILPEEPIEFGSDQTITFDNLLPGVYEIEYYDSFGCGTDGSKLVFDGEGSSDITVDFDRSPFIPNVFTPNNDGKNDFFRILNLPDNGAELVVTNRNGTIVYRDSNYRNSNLWDGGDNPDGVYFYQLTVDGNTQSGWVEIIRGRR